MMETYGTLMLQLLVLVWGVGLPVWVVASLVKNPELTAVTRILLAGLTICAPVVGPVAASILAERVRNDGIRA